VKSDEVEVDEDVDEGITFMAPVTAQVPVGKYCLGFSKHKMLSLCRMVQKSSNYQIIKK